MSSDVIQKDLVYWYVTEEEEKRSESQPLYSVQYNTQGRKKKCESMPSIC